MVRKNKSRSAILTKNLGEDFSVAEILVRFLLLGNRRVELSGRQASYFADPSRFCVRKIEESIALPPRSLFFLLLARAVLAGMCLLATFFAHDFPLRSGRRQTDSIRLPAGLIDDSPKTGQPTIPDKHARLSRTLALFLHPPIGVVTDTANLADHDIRCR
jgi:hypothetical protein